MAPSLLSNVLGNLKKGQMVGTQSLKLITIIALMAVGCTKQSLPLNRVSNSMPPSSLDVTFTTSEDTILFGKLDGRDPENEQLTYSLESNGSIGRAILTNSRTGDFKYIPNANISGVDFFTYSVTDGRGESTPATVTISIITQNDPPDLSETVTDINMNEGESYPSGSVVAEDIDSATVSYRLLESPVQGTFNFNTSTGTFSFTPPTQYFGDDLFFRFDATDGADTSPPVTIRFYITNVPDAPTTQNVDASTSQDEALQTGDFIANDLDGDVLTYCITSNPTHGAAEISTGDATKFRYTPHPGYVGGDSFKYKVSDSGDCVTPNSNESTVNIFVSNVNDAPVANPFSFSVNEDGTYNNTTALHLSWSDPDAGDTVTFIKKTDPANGTATISTSGAITYTPPADYFNTPTTRDTFTYQVRDNNGAFSNINTITITVNPVNDIPTAFPVIATTNEGVGITSALFNANDKENNQLTYLIAASPPPSEGSVTVNPPTTSGTFNFTPFGDFPGTQAQATVRFWYKVVDNGTPAQTSSPVPVDITVINVNDRPTTTNLSGPVTAGSGVIFTLTSSDVDGDTRTYSIDPSMPAHQPAHGTVSIVNNPATNSATATYTAQAGYSGPDQFIFTVNDGKGLPTSTVTGTVSITVRSVAVLTTSISSDAWGYQYSGTTSTRDLTLTNSGETPGAVTSFTAASQGFSVVAGGTCGSMAPFNVPGRVGATNGSCTLRIQFLPSGFSPASQNFVVTYGNGATGGNTTAARTFTGQGKGLPGFTDSTFGTSGRVIVANGGSGPQSHEAMTTQPDGKILVAGYTTSGTRKLGLLSRYNTNGTLDSNFAGTGRTTIGAQNGVDNISFVGVRFATVNAVWRIFVAGTYEDPVNNQRFLFIARFLHDGTIDEEFGGYGFQNVIYNVNNYLRTTITAMDIDSVGRILIAGYSYQNTVVRDGVSMERTSFFAARILRDGGQDYSFANGIATLTFDSVQQSIDKANAIFVQSDGKILVGGSSFISASTGGDQMALARYNANGTLDNTFGPNLDGKILIPFTTGNAGIRALTVHNNRIIAVGYGGTDFGVSVLNMNGTMDTTFDGGDGKMRIDFGSTGVETANAVAGVPGTNFVVMVGAVYNTAQAKFDAGIARIDITPNLPSGLDTTFAGGGRTVTNYGATTDSQLKACVIDTVSDTLQKVYAIGNYKVGTSNADMIMLRYWNQ